MKPKTISIKLPKGYIPNNRICLEIRKNGTYLKLGLIKKSFVELLKELAKK
jgi:hypothetical protein